MKRKTKNIFKKVSFALAGIGAIGAVTFGATQLVNYMKEDTQNLNVSYEVGGLDSNGKYENDNSTIYTKDRFACEGLQASLDFDSTINYEIFYYDILDNFISSSGVLSEGYSLTAPLNGAYARIEITPTDDEDGKVSWMEKFTYGDMLNLKVSKDAEENINKKFTILNGNLFQVVNSKRDMQFVNGYQLDEHFNLSSNALHSSTAQCILNVDGYSKISVNNDLLDSNSVYEFKFIGFEKLDSTSGTLYKINTQVNKDQVITLDNNVKYLLVSVYSNNSEFSSLTSKLNSVIELTK